LPQAIGTLGSSIFQRRELEPGNQVAFFLHLKEAKIAGLALEGEHVQLPLLQARCQGLSRSQVLLPGHAHQQIVAIVRLPGNDQAALAVVPLDAGLVDEHAAGPVLHFAPLEVEHLPGLGRRPLQFGDEDLVLRDGEIMIALSLAVEGADGGLAERERFGLKTLDLERIVAAPLELVGVNADLVLSLFGQADGETALVARIVDFQENLVICFFGPGQLQDRVEFVAGHMGDDRFALLSLENPTVDLTWRQEPAMLAGATKVVHRQLGAGGEREQKQNEEQRPHFRFHDNLLVGS
jgi:hypothetical protein